MAIKMMAFILMLNQTKRKFINFIILLPPHKNRTGGLNNLKLLHHEKIS